jgi:hydrogenase maturation protease
MLILGCGNPDRSDDAAGLLVAQRLGQLGVEAHEQPGEMLALMDAWSGAAEVILIDAVMSGAPPGEITRWDGAAPLPREPFRCSTHALGVAEAVELARALGRLPPKLILYGIEGMKFDRGGPVSPEVADAVERLAQDIARQTRTQG